MKMSHDGMSLRYLKIYAVDSKGRKVTNATDKVTVKVSGAAELVAIDNGDHYTNDLFHDVNTKQMQSGYMQAIIRGKRTEGKVNVEVNSPTLKSAKVTF